MSLDNRRRQEVENRPEMDESADDTHPALKNFSRFGAMAKHVAGRTLKWGVIGGLAGAATLGVGAAALGVVGVNAIPFGLGWITGGAALTTSTGQAFVGNALASAAMTGLKYGAMAGGAAGLATGAMGASEHADNEEERLMARYQQRTARDNYMARLREQQRRQHLALERSSDGMRNPNQSLPYARQSGQGMDQSA